MGDDLKKKSEDPAMEAINAVIDEEQREELEEHELKQEGEATSVFLFKGSVPQKMFGFS